MAQHPRRVEAAPPPACVGREPGQALVERSAVVFRSTACGAWRKYRQFRRLVATIPAAEPFKRRVLFVTASGRSIMPITLADLRRFAVARSLFPPTTLARAIDRLGFVQADPIRAPARAQDLTLRHRVTSYRAGDLERRYDSLEIEEDFFVNYGFLPRAVHSLMHPRAKRASALRGRKAQEVLAFVRARAAVHPREVDEHFSHGSVTNYWGGSSAATTHLLDRLHYGGVLRVARRAGGIRIYTAHATAPGAAGAAERRARLDALVDVAAQVYAPLPAASLAWLVSRLRYAVPQWTADLRLALVRAKTRLAHARVEGTDWYWPTGEQTDGSAEAVVRLLAPFDPVVWDRRRFELFWGWRYRFEAYTPAPKRKLGYYSLPLLWGDRVVGWANLSVTDGRLGCEVGFVPSRPRARKFSLELAAELERMRAFLGLEGDVTLRQLS
jgi:uncharacterized protein YcaQ